MNDPQQNTNSNDKQLGSQWRIWDLHIHPPKINGGDYTTFISNLASCKASVIGINDYCSLEGYNQILKLGGVPGKVLFPVVEFRMNNIVANRKSSTTKSGAKINFHVIFDNDPTVLEIINRLLNSLKCFEYGIEKQLGSAHDVMKVTFDFDYVIKELNSILPGRSLIWLPYDEYGGIDEIDPEDSFFKLFLITKAHIIGTSTKKQIEFFKWNDPKFSQEHYRQNLKMPKPCIKGSDAHDLNYPFGHLRDNKSQPIDKFCWLNTDMTFNGLSQILIEPDRVFIGEEPDLITRVRNNPTKFIKSLSINKIMPTGDDNVWYENFKLNLNSGLVAIIGNKGSGKSAITDIISLAGNTHQDPSNFSFLTNNKFRKPKSFNLSEKFEAVLEWHDGSKFPKKLNLNPDKNAPARVKYIPQNFLENLCTNVDQDDFEDELMKIIYSHTPNEKKLGKASLEELIAYKTSLINKDIDSIKGEISKLNLEIVFLENKATDGYKKVIENKLQLKNEELTAHINIKPQQPPVIEGNEESKKLIAKLSELRERILSLETNIADDKKTLAIVSLKLAELERANQFYSNLSLQLKKHEDDEYAKILQANEISIASVFTYSISQTPITEAIGKLKSEILLLNKALDITNERSKVFQLKSLKDELKNGQEELDKPAKIQQKYLDELKEWEDKKKHIEGSSDIEESLKFYDTQLEYLKTRLLPELASKRETRSEFARQLFTKKLALIEERKQLFEPVTKFIDEFKELKAKYDVKVDVSLEGKTFTDSFLNYLNLGKTGSFSGKEEGFKRVIDILDKANLLTQEGFIAFTKEIEKNLNNDSRYKEKISTEPSSQLRKGVELNSLYDFIYHGDYLQPVYNLKLGTKTLLELSPGERGALLLIFYLVLDNDDIPLIIDQPEENLDNETIYHILVHFIKKVKEKRQIIIVTHNPNLAVVCDADQIVHMQIEKDNRNTVKYYSGAIEDLRTNKAVLDILEGTLPAFNNRDLKYIR